MAAEDPIKEILRLREMVKWQTRVIGQLQHELRAERAIADFWAAEADRLEPWGRMGSSNSFVDWHRERR